MEDRELYRELLHIEPPWGVERVHFDKATGRVLVYLKFENATATCPECGVEFPIKSFADEQERLCSHTLGFKTIVRVEVPKVECDRHGVQVTSITWPKIKGILEGCSPSLLNSAPVLAVLGILVASLTAIILAPLASPALASILDLPEAKVEGPAWLIVFLVVLFCWFWRVVPWPVRITVAETTIQKTAKDGRTWGEKRRVVTETIIKVGVPVVSIALIAGIAIPQLLNAKRSAWETRAKSTLKLIGTSQLAYQSTNSSENFGSFNALLSNEYIAKGYRPSNIIDNYSLYWEVNTLSIISPEDAIQHLNTFTVVAFPIDTRNKQLATYAVREDQVVRVFNPEQGDKFDLIYTWDPIF